MAKVRLVRQDDYTFGGNLDDLIKRLQTLRDAAPEEYRDKLEYEYRGDRDGGVEFELWYNRQKTPAELGCEENLRIATARRIEQDERQTLAALKVKYGG